MKECFLITSYCNNQDKVKRLTQTIDKLRTYNIDIILYEHFPQNDQIQQLVNYYIFAGNNPINTRKTLIYWKCVDNLKLSYIIKDHTYTVMKEWKEGLSFLKDKYDIIHVINYDIYLDDDFFSIHQNIIKKENKSIFYKNVIDKSQDNVLTTFFSILSKDINNFVEFIDEEEYYNSEFYVEHYIYNKTIKNNPNFFIVYNSKEYSKIYKYELSVLGVSGLYTTNSSPFDIFKRDYGWIFCGKLDNTFHLYCWEIKNKIDVEINDRIFYRGMNGKFMLNTFENKLDNIKIKIDGEAFDINFCQLNTIERL